MPANVFMLPIDIFMRFMGGAQAAAQVQQTTNDIEGSLRKTGGGTRQVVRDVAGAFTALFVVDRIKQTVQGLVQPAIEMQSAMAGLAGITGLTGKQLDALQNSAVRAAAATTFSPIEAVRGLEQLIRSGLGAADAQGVLKESLELAQASMGKLDTEQAAKITGALFREMGLAGDNLRKGLSQVLFLTARFGVDMAEMPRLIARMRSAMAATGATFEDTAIAAGFLAAQQLSGARAATLLRTMMFKLTDPKIQRALRENFGTFIEGAENINTVQDVILRVVRAVDQGSISAAQARSRLIQFLTTTRGGEAAIILFDKLHQGIRLANGELVRGEQAVSILTDQFKKTTLLEDVLAKARKTLTFQTQQLTEQWTRFLVTVGTPAVKVFTAITTAVTWLAMRMADFFESNSVIARVLSGAVIPALLIAASAIATLGAPILTLIVGHRLLAVAATFLGTSYVAVRAAFVGAAEGLWTFVTTIPRALFSVRALTFSLKGLGAAVRFAFGWVSLILIALDLLSLVWDNIAGLAPSGSDDLVNAQREQTKAAMGAADATRDIGKSWRNLAQDVTDVTKPLTDTLSKLTGAATTELPRVKESALVQIEALAQREARAGRLAPERAQEIRTAGVAIRKALGPGGELLHENLEDVQRLVGQMSARFQVGTGLRLPKMFAELAKAVEGINSEDLRLLTQLAKEPIDTEFLRRTDRGLERTTVERGLIETREVAGVTKEELARMSDEVRKARAIDLAAVLGSVERANLVLNVEGVEILVDGGKLDLAVIKTAVRKDKATRKRLAIARPEGVRGPL